MPGATTGSANPAGWPEEVLSVLERAPSCEFATAGGSGRPVTYPLSPYMGRDRRTIDVQTGLTYPAKAERVRRNPKVCMLLSEFEASGISDPPVVLVYGHGAVLDRDIQANTDRYVSETLAKYPTLYKDSPRWLLRRMAWYFARIWITVTPLRILWWPGGKIDDEPRRWEAPAGIALPPSDPAPPGGPPPPWKRPPDWREQAAYALEHLGAQVLTVADEEGYPAPVRLRAATPAPDGFRLSLPGWTPPEPAGKACLTFHAHVVRGGEMVGGDNRVFLGEVERRDDEAVFRVERALGDQSGGGSKLRLTMRLLANRRALLPRLQRECARRGQPVPTINLPR